MSRVAQQIKSKLIIIPALVIILGGGTALVVHDNHSQVHQVKNSQNQTTEISYKGKQGVDALTLLKSHAQVQTKHYSFGDLVTSINGNAGNGPKYWTFYVNGKEAQTGANSYITKDTDTLSWASVRNYLLALALIVFAVGLRLLPHPDNFAPLTAVAIFGGVVLPRKLAVYTPLLAAILSDVVIGFYNIILVTWMCYALIALASSYQKKADFIRRATLVVSASLFFFVVTNFAVFLWSGMYAHNLAGLEQCYTMALPFFRNTALSDLFYTGALFGALWFSSKMLLTKLRHAV